YGVRKYPYKLEFRVQWIKQRTEQIKNGCDTLFRELLSNRCDQLKRRVIKRGKEKPNSRLFDTGNHPISRTRHRDSQFLENISASRSRSDCAIAMFQHHYISSCDDKHCGGRN